MKREIPGLYDLKPCNWFIPQGISVRQKLWWRFMPGVVITVAWPKGEIIVGPDDPRWDWTLGATSQSGFSADPNDHYRPWMEKHVGRQGWDWNWGLADQDCTNSTLTIKIRQKYAECTTIAVLKWS